MYQWCYETVVWHAEILRSQVTSIKVFHQLKWPSTNPPQDPLQAISLEVGVQWDTSSEQIIFKWPYMDLKWFSPWYTETRNILTSPWPFFYQDNVHGGHERRSGQAKNGTPATRFWWGPGQHISKIQLSNNVSPDMILVCCGISYFLFEVVFVHIFMMFSQLNYIVQIEIVMSCSYIIWYD